VCGVTVQGSVHECGKEVYKVTKSKETRIMTQLKLEALLGFLEISL
jgi:hypothetical protein